MSQRARIAIIAIAALGLVLAFFAARGSEEADDPPSRTTSTQAAPSTSPGVGEDGGVTAPETARQAETTPAEPEVPTVEVVGGKPRGGVQELEFKKGDTIRFRVRSDTPDEIHVHGFDKYADVGPGQARDVPLRGRPDRALRGRAARHRHPDRLPARRAVRQRALLVAGGATLLALTALLVPAGALAHGLVGRQDLPIPRWLFAWGAAVVLVASFVALAVALGAAAARSRSPRSASSASRRRSRCSPASLGVAAFGVVVYAGLAGTQTPTANLAPTVVYVLFWVGIPVLSLLLGDVFQAFNPWRAIARAVGWVATRVAGRDALPEPMPYPERLGRWPAAVGLLASPGSSSSAPTATTRRRWRSSRLPTRPCSSSAWPLRRRRVDPPRRRVRGRTSRSSPAWRRCAGATARCGCARRSAACRR